MERRLEEVPLRSKISLSERTHPLSIEPLSYVCMHRCRDYYKIGSRQREVFGRPAYTQYNAWKVATFFNTQSVALRTYVDALLTLLPASKSKSSASIG